MLIPLCKPFCFLRTETNTNDSLWTYEKKNLCFVASWAYGTIFVLLFFLRSPLNKSITQMKCPPTLSLDANSSPRPFKFSQLPVFRQTTM